MMNQASKSVLNSLEVVILRNLCNFYQNKEQEKEKEEIKDRDSVLRALYSLEGKHLVRPEPKKDLTSRLWVITDFGINTVELLSKNNQEKIT